MNPLKNDAHLYLLTRENIKYSWVSQLQRSGPVHLHKSNMSWKYDFWVRGEGDFHFWAQCEMVKVQTWNRHAAFGGPFQTTGRLQSYKTVQEACKGPGLELWLWQEPRRKELQAEGTVWAKTWSLKYVTGVRNTSRAMWPRHRLKRDQGLRWHWRESVGQIVNITVGSLDHIWKLVGSCWGFQVAQW